MPKDPVIVQFDFDDNYSTVVDLIFYNIGLSRSFFGRTYSEAEKYISQLSSTKKYPDIALVATYLGKGSMDGQEIAKKLKEASPKTTIIAYTADDEAKWGDYLALKSSDETTLIKVLEKLTGKSFNYDNSHK